MREPATGSEPRSLHERARGLLTTWSAPDDRQEFLRAQFLEFLEEHDDGVDRACPDGHITASTLVVDSTRARCLLTLHPKVGRWLQTGGHVEPSDSDLWSAARREAVEESGIDDLVVDPAPAQLDRHRVQCGGRELDHLDVQFVGVAGPGAVERISAESLDLAWFPVDRLPVDSDDAVRSLVARARGRAVD